MNPTLSKSPAIFWAQKAITDYRDGGGETRILVSGNDVTYGPHNGEQMTPERLLALGEAVGRRIQRQLFGG